MSHDQEYDLEGWLGKGVDLWALWDVVMDEHGEVTRLAWSKSQGKDISVICWAPTSGMLRRRVKP